METEECQCHVNEQQFVRPRSMRPSVAILGFKNLSSRRIQLGFQPPLGDVDRRMRPASNCALCQPRLAPYEDRPRSIRYGKSAPPPLCRKFARPRSYFIILGSYLALEKKPAKFGSTFAPRKTRHGTTRHRHFGKQHEKAHNLPRVQVGSRLRGQFGLRTFSPVESVGLRAELPSNPEPSGSIRKGSPGSERSMHFRPESPHPRRRCRSLFPLAHSGTGQGVVIPGYDAMPGRNQRQPWMEQAISRVEAPAGRASS